MKENRVIIAGGRDFDDKELLYTYCDAVLGSIQSDTIEIVHGGAKGADTLGGMYAIDRGYQVVEFIPKWDEHGKFAGILRNRDMADYATHLIAFWDGVSRGTKNMIEEASKRKLIVRVVNYDNSN